MAAEDSDISRGDPWEAVAARIAALLDDPDLPESVKAELTKFDWNRFSFSLFSCETGWEVK